MSRKHNRLCIKCGRNFSVESSELETCFPCTNALKYQSMIKHNRFCTICFESFYSQNKVKKCPCCSMKPYSNATKKSSQKEQPMKPKKKHGKIPLEVLEKMEEKKRVYDENYANNFIRYGGVRERI